MKADLYWVPGPWPGRLAIAPRPRGGDWLADDLAAWRRAGVGVVVSLLTPDEVADLDLADEDRLGRAAGMDVVSFPITDRGVPPSTAAAAGLFATLAGALAAGTSVLVHCRQGIGRSAVIAAGLLVRAGLDADAALRRVADARGLPVPETDDQRRWVAALARPTAGRLPA
jgi:protein-tyrosine phosphatase